MKRRVAPSAKRTVAPQEEIEADKSLLEARLLNSNRRAARWLSELAKAQLSVGRNSTVRLKWLLDFAQRKPEDLLRFSADALGKLDSEITVFHLREGYDLEGGVGPHPATRTAEAIAEIAVLVRGGIRQFMASQGWRFSIVRLTRLLRRNSRLNRIVGVRTASSPDRILMAAADLLEREGLRIKQCAWPGCIRLFVKRKRATYCSPRCSQRARMQRFRLRHQNELAERRHRYYIEQVRRERGNHVAKLVRSRFRGESQRPSKKKAAVAKPCRKGEN